MTLTNALSAARNGRPAGLIAALCLSVSFPAFCQPGTTIHQPLVQGGGAVLWTQNGNLVPMCWHELLQFPNPNAANDAKAFVAQTIQDGWISRLNLRITWVNCPVSGNDLHVRVKLRSGDSFNGGTTKQVGMATLSVASQRLVPPPNDPPGLLMGFQANWNSNDATRAGFRSLILHEFGHILGFDHEQRRPDGPPGVSCYTNSLPNAIKIGPADPQSIMGWSYCVEALGVLTAGDISAARSVYGRGDIIAPDFPSLLQLHDTGAIWSFTGKPCRGQACPGWELIDKNPRTESVSGHYQRHVDGKIWRWDGRLRCTGNECPGWTLIDTNPKTRVIAAGVDGLYSRHVDGKIWKFTGGACNAAACPGWTLIDSNPRTEDIAVGVGAFAASDLYQRHVDGKIWVWDGRSRCTGNACPGWTLIDNNPATKQIVAAGGTLYQRHTDGKIWVWDGQSRCSATSCPGWKLIDNNPRTETLAGGHGGLYQRHVDGKIWKWDGGRGCTAAACPGWSLIDSNPKTRELAAAGTVLYQRHSDGQIWKWDGRSRCTVSACPGWQLMDINPHTKALAAQDTKFDNPGLH